MEEAGYCMEIDENGDTFEENALLKAKALSGISGDITVADDSGLVVDRLDGAPGVFSSRFAGEGASDEDKNRKLLGMLEGVPLRDRTARFVCAVAVVFPDGRNFTVKGSCEGYIGFEPRGVNGFGYDPLFHIPEYGATIAELDSDVKNMISHRGKAFRLMADELRRGWLVI